MTAPDGQTAYRPRPLVLPPTGHGYPEGSYVSYPTDLPHPAGYELFGSGVVDVERLFWYRWIAGHQVSFIVWRTIGDLLRIHPDDTPPPHHLDALTACVEGYSAMLLYAATIPRNHYHAYLRVRMAAQHPSFSGTWAPDYRPLRRLLRGRVSWLRDPSCAALREAVELSRRTHDHVADHLVPAGRSLLQRYAEGAHVGISQEEEDLYDNFFLVVRRPISHAEVVAQLHSRLLEITADLTRNGLYPEVCGAHFPVVTGSPGGDATHALATGVLRILHKAALLTEEIGRPLEKVR